VIKIYKKELTENQKQIIIKNLNPFLPRIKKEVLESILLLITEGEQDTYIKKTFSIKESELNKIKNEIIETAFI